MTQDLNPRRRGIGGHQSAGGWSDTWLTPPWLVSRLGPFDFDPCAAPHPRPWPTAREHICLPDDGLTALWHGMVWCNPPYGDQTWRWLHRLADHGQGIALIFARTETAGFFASGWERADAMLFLRGRLTFHLPNGIPGRYPAGAPSVLLAYGMDAVQRLEAAALGGALVHGWRRTGPLRLNVEGVAHG